jgi:glycosyltransferase involved in cell wall biosynthesis
LCLHPFNNLPPSTRDDWDICLALGSEVNPLKLGDNGTWAVADEILSLFTAIDIRARSLHLGRIEGEIAADKESELKVSVIICTHNRGEKIIDTLRSVAQQTLPKADYEIILVNNDPDQNQVAPIVEGIREEYFSDHPDRLSLIDCPVLGLSSARNAGISAARGEILYFLDDDAVAAEDTLELYWQAFSEHPQAGVIGGQIILELPETMPMIWKEGWGKYWSEFIPDFSDYREVENWWEFPWGANWCARREALWRIGGFQTGYGRRGNDFSGGEEIIAAVLIKELGYSVAVHPQAKVIHQIEKYRFSLDHLKNTIKAGLFTEYQAQQHLHFPEEKNVLKAAKLVKNVGANLLGRFDSPSTRKKADRIERNYYLAARWSLFIRQLSDSIKRFRKPITRK